MLSFLLEDCRLPDPCAYVASSGKIGVQLSSDFLCARFLAFFFLTRGQDCYTISGKVDFITHKRRSDCYTASS